MPSTRILVADDFKDWRRKIRLLLQTRPELQIICEVANGSKAVEKAEELKPDLILLDIGLPVLNGIEAARQIRHVSPTSKIIFLSQQKSLDVVQEALGTGARAYVYKADAQSELVSAVDALLLGKQFVSRTLNKFRKSSYEHAILIYSDDRVLLEGFTRFVAPALKAGNAAVVIATKSHRDDLLQRLKAESVDVDGHEQKGTYIALDAANAFSAIMVDDLPDPTRFYESIGGLMEAATKSASANHPRVAFCGEALGALWTEGKVEAAIRIEQLSNDLARKHEIDMLCAYPLSSFHSGNRNQAFRSICAEHSAVRFC
jgi:DNA-binding NarL/FixJ family response regulator